MGQASAPDERLDMVVTADGHVDGRAVERTVTTHSARLWFVDDLVVKRKRPVDLGFLDFRRLSDRVEACRRELELNRRLGDDVHLGLADVTDDAGAVVDVAVVMRRLPDGARLATRARAGDDLGECIGRVARAIARFHADLSPSPRGRELAGPAALRTNWEDNLAVLRAHPDLAPGDLVAAVAAEATTWLDGRGPLLEQRLADGMVRDGHGDLVADDVFCLDDGPRILDCLDFADRYRINDVLADVAFLAMDLERLGRADLAAELLERHAEFLGDRRDDGLAHHYVAYRASVRAKVACLVDEPDGATVVAHLDLAHRHLHRARVRMVLVGGLPGTGKSTVGRGLADQLGAVVLRSDEVRKDLLGRAHHEPAGAGGYDAEVTAGTYAELLDRARALLAHGVSVVLDASWADPLHRRVAVSVAREVRADLREVELRVPAAVAHARLRARRGDASDAGVAVHERMREAWVDWPGATVVDADADRDRVVQQGVAAVGLARPVSPARRSGRSGPP